MEDLVQLSFPADGVAQVLVGTGPRNFSTFAANEQLLQALDDSKRRGTRVVVVGSAVNGVFVGHGWLPDVLDTFTGGAPSGDPLAGVRGFTELDTGPMVSIAAVDGEAWGHGAELAWACDLRVASSSALFGQPEVHVGTCPGSGGSIRLVRLVGEAIALRLLLDGRPVDGGEAMRLGLVHRVVQPGHALDEAVSWATWLAGRPPQGLEACKRAVKSTRDLAIRDALKHEMSVFIEMLSRPDTQDLVREVQRRYEQGADTRTAFGLD